MSASREEEKMSSRVKSMTLGLAPNATGISQTEGRHPPAAD